MKNTFYVYKLVDPRSKLPFYIGKGNGNRIYSHEQLVKNNKVPNGNTYLFNKIRKILKLGYSIEYCKIAENISEQDAFQLEISEIQKYGIRGVGCLCNLTIGGDGVTGRKASQAEREANRLRAIISFRDPLFRKKYEDGRAKVDWIKVRQKQSETLKHRFATDLKFRRNHRRKITQVSNTQESRDKNSKVISEFYKTHPDQKRKLSEIQKELWASGKYDNSKSWKFKSPGGKMFKFKNLNQFCKSNNLTPSLMNKVSRKERNHHRGWTIA